jgi:hypothetical protein
METADERRGTQPGLGLRPRPEPRLPLAKHAKAAKKRGQKAEDRENLNPWRSSRSLREI